MNYNRCVFSLPNAHDDAVSRIRVIDHDPDNKLVLTSSWDSLLKAWIVPLGKDTLKAHFITELAFESSVADFHVSQTHLAAITNDGNAHLWRLDARKLISRYEKYCSFKFGYLATEQNLEESIEMEDYDFADFNLEKSDNNQNEEYDNSYNGFTFLHSVQCCDSFGKINDCRLIEDIGTGPSTLAVCTSLGYVKIFDLKNNSELFSLKVNENGISNNLMRLIYTQEFIIAAGSQGLVYFIDLKHGSNEGSDETTHGKFLRHTLKVSECQLHSLSIYKEFLICIGDSEGNVHFLSLMDLL